MERAMLWFKCAAVHDPVRPVVKKQAVLGWEAKHRQVDLRIERPLRAEELLTRMKGWFTADVYEVARVIKQHGKLRLLDERELSVETPDRDSLERLSDELNEVFGPEVWVEHIPKKRLE